jgi:hypothetical protein
MRWWYRSALDDWAIVEIQKACANYETERFHVNLATVLGPWRKWLYSEYPNAQDARREIPTGASAIILDRLSPQQMDQYGGWGLADQASAVAAGEFAARELASIAIPRLKRRLDRDSLLAELEAKGRPTARFRAAFLAQAGDVAGAEAAMANDTIVDDADRIRRWLREYAAEHAQTATSREA